jgi:hypothetical protein
MMKVGISTSFLAFALVTVSASAATAQVVQGRVVDAETGVPIQDVRLTLVDSMGALVAYSGSDVRGAFELRPRQPGSYSVLAERLGYAAFRSDPVDVARGSEIVVAVRMGVDAIPLEPFVVFASSEMRLGRIAEFERRRDDPTLGGHFLDADDVRARPMASPTQLLRTLPSVDLTPIITEDNRLGSFDRSLIYLPGSRGGSLRAGMCLAQVYVDGVQVQQSQSGAFSIDDYLAGAPIGGVELYTRASAAPPQYRGTGECGVVLYWTEEPAASQRGWGMKRIAAGFGLIAGLVLFGLTR